MSDEQKQPSGLYNKWNLDVAKFASKDSTRLNLNSILVEPRATVATDGHQLVKVSAPNHETKLENFPVIPGVTMVRPTVNFLLPASTALEVSKQIPRKSTFPVLQNAAVLDAGTDHVGMVTTDLDSAKPVTVRKVEGIFPNYQTIIDDLEKVTVQSEVTLNGLLLGELAKFLGQFNGGKQPAIKLTIFEPIKNSEGEVKCQRAVRLTATNSDTGQEAYAVLMPMRD